MNKPHLFYSELQKLNFLKKIKNLSESFNGDKNTVTSAINNYIMKK